MTQMDVPAPPEIHLSFAEPSLFSSKSVFTLSARSVSSLLRYEIAQKAMPFQCHSCHAKLFKMGKRPSRIAQRVPDAPVRTSQCIILMHQAMLTLRHNKII